MSQQIRIARPVADLTRSVAMYTSGLDLREVASFYGHAGFDGVMLEEAGKGFHFGFTYCSAHLAAPSVVVRR